jgi:hypothetical protein
MHWFLNLMDELGIECQVKTSVVAGRSSKAVQPVRGCQKRRMVRIVTGRLIRLPALPG